MGLSIVLPDVSELPQGQLQRTIQPLPSQLDFAQPKFHSGQALNHVGQSGQARREKNAGGFVAFALPTR
jgi:hypothetical protein